MKEKYIRVEFEDEIWKVPLRLVAENRAEYYKSKEEDDFNYDEEVEFIMENEFEGIDWFQNNMDMHEFINEMEIEPIKVENNDRDWINAEKEIVDGDEDNG